MSPERRRFIIKELSGAKCLLDLDIRREHEEIEFLQREKLKVRTILSFHDYEKTPLARELQEIVDEMQRYGAAVYKISTFCRNEADAVRLLVQQLILKEKGVEHIVLGMGVHGQITRVFGTLWGNKLIFAPTTDAESSAPGQLTIDQLREIFRQLDIAAHR